MTRIHAKEIVKSKKENGIEGDFDSTHRDIKTFCFSDKESLKVNFVR